MTALRGRIPLVVTAVAVLVVVGWLALRPGARPEPVPAGAPATVSPSAPASPAPPVLVPGRPGEPAVTRPGDQVRDAGSPRYNTLDVWFVRLMIPHHQQALEMADLAPTRAGSPAIRALAERIRGAQQPEIGMMRGWLDSRGLPAEAAGHDHGGMLGMQSPEAMRRLADARGAAFDRLFVEMMSAHHRGAVTMATELLTAGADQQLNEFANALATEQTVEIARMRELL